MSRDDLLRIYRQFFPFGNAAPFVDRIIKILAVRGGEVDGSGGGGFCGIEFAEYVTGLSVISRGRLDEKLYCTQGSEEASSFLIVLGSFKFCDFDGDGWISKEDLLNSIELIHQLMGRMFQFQSKEADSLNDSSPDSDQINDTFTPLNRTNHLFTLMDEDGDGRADYNDFKRTVLNDAEIIQGFLVYDGVI